jgi:hypothetical protein
MAPPKASTGAKPAAGKDAAGPKAASPRGAAAVAPSSRFKPPPTVPAAALYCLTATVVAVIAWQVATWPARPQSGAAASGGPDPACSSACAASWAPPWLKEREDAVQRLVQVGRGARLDAAVRLLPPRTGGAPARGSPAPGSPRARSDAAQWLNAGGVDTSAVRVGTAGGVRGLEVRAPA